MRAMKGQREAKREGGSKLPWIITGGVAGVLAAAYIGTCAWASGRSTIFPNVAVAGVDVSNMTVEQAQSAVQAALDQGEADILALLVQSGLHQIGRAHV